MARDLPMGLVQTTGIDKAEVDRRRRIVDSCVDQYSELESLDDSFRLQGFHDTMEAYIVRCALAHWSYRIRGTGADNHFDRKVSCLQARNSAKASLIQAIQTYDSNRKYRDRVSLGIKFLQMTQEERDEYNRNRKQEG